MLLDAPVSSTKDQTWDVWLRELEEAARTSLRHQCKASLKGSASMLVSEWVGAFPRQCSLLVDQVSRPRAHSSDDASEVCLRNQARSERALSVHTLWRYDAVVAGARSLRTMGMTPPHPSPPTLAIRVISGCIVSPDVAQPSHLVCRLVMLHPPPTVRVLRSSLRRPGLFVC